MRIKKRISKILILSILSMIFISGRALAEEVPTDQYTFSFSEQYGTVKESMTISRWDSESEQMVTDTKEYQVIYVPIGAQLEFKPTVSLGATICPMYEYKGVLEEDFQGLLWEINGAQFLQNYVDANEIAKATLNGDNNTYYRFRIHNFDNYSTEIFIKIVSSFDETLVDEEKSNEEETNADNQDLDVPDKWAKEEVEHLISLGIVPSSIQNNYKENITRDEFCNLVINLIEVKTGKKINILISDLNRDVAENPFIDTDKEWIINANSLEVVSGRGNGIFDPEGNITRQEAAVMLTNTADVLGIEVGDLNSVFADDSKIASWAKSSVGFVSNEGIMVGMGNNIFNPKGTYTRQQAIVTVLRLFNCVK